MLSLSLAALPAALSAVVTAPVAGAVALIDPYEEIIRPTLAIVGIGVISIAMLALAVRVMESFLPFAVRHEIEEDHNVAAAIVMASIILGVALVIAAVAHG